MRTEVVGCSMLTKCSNPSCSAPFRYLEEGRLFLLESDPALRPRNSNRAEYFWLCHGCSYTMTLRLGKSDRVVAVPLPEAIRRIPDGVALISADRKRGLWLRSISSPLRERPRGRVSARHIDEHDVA